MTEISFERQCLHMAEALITAYLNKDNDYLHGILNTLAEDFTFIDESSAVSSHGWTALLKGCSLPENSVRLYRQEPLSFTLQSLTPDTNVIYGISMSFRCTCVCCLSGTGLPLIHSLHISVPCDFSTAQEAQLDSLTRLYNRCYTEKHISKRLLSDKKYSLFMLDLDDFKIINDTLGHPTGDMILKKIAEILQNIFDNNAVLGRIGGDELLAYTSDTKIERQPEATAQKIIASIGMLMQQYGLKQSCSIGIVRGSAPSVGFTPLYQTVDMALYQAKDSGKAGYNIICLP